MFKVGEATVTRVEETNLPSYLLRDIFPEFNDAHMAEHKAWMAPHHYDADDRTDQARRAQLAARSSAARKS